MQEIILGITAALCFVASFSWGRIARYRWRFYQQVRAAMANRRAEETSDAALGGDGGDGDDEEAHAAEALARSSFLRDLHAASLYLLLAVIALFLVTTDTEFWTVLMLVVGVPAALTMMWGRKSGSEFRMARERFDIERRAQEALAQEELAPRAWAGRLAPEGLAGFEGFAVGQVYLAGSGLMAGDFFDVFEVAPGRLAAVIGDVAGKGIESSITAFQAKYLMRVFLRQFRDPAQAVEELNRQIFNAERTEEFISLVVLIFDTAAGTLRYASAGHPTAWLWHQREVLPLNATGPLLMLEAASGYFSREIPLMRGDMAVLYTDGLIEARRGGDQFGEEAVAMLLRREPLLDPGELCRHLLEAARDFSDSPLGDDVAILAVRRT
ncbi:MAG: serine/threonine-protein phosphatase [Acidimicrobiia bacterium]|nr:serine/threonine-protein phosphatase [Acidimicrobiia bacterium]